MKIPTKYNQISSIKLSDEEKRNYCLKWSRSGQSKAAFCRSIGISKSAFYLWCNQFHEEFPIDAAFSPVTLKSEPSLNPEALLQLEICLPNQTKIFIPMQKANVISFIQELCHATTVIR
jgi:hypothetical protein